MAAKCDVVVHNFRIGAMAKWGLGYERHQGAESRRDLLRVHRLRHAKARWRISARTISRLQAHSGLLSVTGEPDRPPVRVGTAAIDLHGSLALVSAVLAALFHRERSGEGQVIETSLLMSSAHLLSYFYTEYWMDGTVRKPMGTANHLSVPNQVFPTADGGVVIIAPNDEMWQRCVDALGEPSLDRPEFERVLERLRRREELVEAVSAVTRA